MNIGARPGDAVWMSETYYCDYRNAVFACVAVPHGETPRETAMALFEYVRDTMPLSADSLGVTASETLEKGYGACWNKALVLVALLRKHSIPGRIVKRPLRRVFLKPLIGNGVYVNNNPYYHCFVQAHLAGGWVSADPSLDARTYETCYKPMKVPWDIQWDGKSDHVIHTDHSAGAPEVIEDIDASFNAGIGNRSIPNFIIPFLNGNYWKKTGWDAVMSNRRRT
ncbi:MAG TPA: transglutaminase family protein [Spirochaetota bacterium]|nr:transglutaminase family protein [Spirochaetota bacterium]HNT12976.1 transglutaminase family protein [Spirochaetota bacterium]